jgi:hypothetical protein
MIIVETTEELDVLLTKLRYDNCVVDVVLIDIEKHALNNNPSLIITYFPKHNDLFVIPIAHNEGVTLDGAFELFKQSVKNSLRTKFCFDKKKMSQIFGFDLGFTDLNIIKYLDVGSIEDFEDVSNDGSRFILSTFRRCSNLNRAIPICKHCDLFLQKFSKFTFPPENTYKDKSFEFLNSVAVSRFAELEAVGLAVDKTKFENQFGDEQLKNIKDGLIFTQYNLFTSTGRPSNRFGGINFAAMNKKDGSRQPFVSRFGDDGMLVMIDYSAFHPRLIANLANYPLGFDVNPYEYLAGYFFKTDKPTPEEISLSKGYTFQQLYGGIKPQYAHIPYYKKVQEYIDHRWRYFEENGFVETPVYFRKIKPCNIENPSPNTLFNYILQAYETEVAVLTLGRVLDHLKGKLTQPILYTYDSLLFDAHRQDGRETIKQIRDIMVDKTFPVKIFVGKDYHDMRKIELD